MRIDRRLTIIGVMLVVLSMTMATQYAVTKVGYTYSIVHPSDADIRFIGFDNSSDAVRVLRTASGTNTSGSLNLEIRLGNLSENQNKTYTAAFGIVNEEKFAVNITHVVLDTDTGVDYMKIWLHGRPNMKAADDETSVLIWDMGAVAGVANGSTAWTLAAGNANAADMNGTNIETDFDAIYDREKNLVGYKIKDNKSDSILSFSLDQFGEDKGGLIFVPSWYTKGVKTIEKLEFKDRISPELTWLLKDRTITEEELYSIFVKHDDIVANYIEEAVALRELLNSRLKILERERITLKEDLMDLTEKRLIKDIDRRKFSEVVMQHRRKVNVLDVNIKKCKELIERLEQTSFGILSRNIISKVEKKDWKDQKNRELQEEDKIVIDEVEKSYKNKYYDIQVRYDELVTTLSR